MKVQAKDLLLWMNRGWSWKEGFKIRCLSLPCEFATAAAAALKGSEDFRRSSSKWPVNRVSKKGLKCCCCPGKKSREGNFVKMKVAAMSNLPFLTDDNVYGSEECVSLYK